MLRRASLINGPALFPSPEIGAKDLQQRFEREASEDGLSYPQRPRKLAGDAIVSTVVSPHADEGRIVAEAYSLLPGDLRDTKACQAALEAAQFDPACPTYVLAECVLVYMEPEDSASVVSWLGHWLCAAAFVVYEQVGASYLRFKGSMCIPLSFRRVIARVHQLCAS